MKIDIGILTYSKILSVYVADDTQKFILDGQNISYSQDFLEDAINIVKNWPDHIEDNEMRDGVVYKITYNDGNVERTVTGNNKTPENFSDLTRLINRYIPKTREQRLRESFQKKRFGIK